MLDRAETAERGCRTLSAALEAERAGTAYLSATVEELTRQRDAAMEEYARLKADRGDLLADIGCYVATRSFWPLSLREAIKRHDIEAVRAETARADGVVKQWLEDSHALAAERAEVQRQRTVIAGLTLRLYDTREGLYLGEPCWCPSPTYSARNGGDDHHAKCVANRAALAAAADVPAATPGPLAKRYQTALKVRRFLRPDVELPESESDRAPKTEAQIRAAAVAEFVAEQERSVADTLLAKVREQARAAALAEAVDKLNNSTFARNPGVMETVGNCIALIRSLAASPAPKPRIGCIVGDEPELTPKPCATRGGTRSIGVRFPNGRDAEAEPCPDCAKAVKP